MRGGRQAGQDAPVLPRPQLASFAVAAWPCSPRLEAQGVRGHTVMRVFQGPSRAALTDGVQRVPHVAKVRVEVASQRKQRLVGELVVRPGVPRLDRVLRKQGGREGGDESQRRHGQACLPGPRARLVLILLVLHLVGTAVWGEEANRAGVQATPHRAALRAGVS